MKQMSDRIISEKIIIRNIRKSYKYSTDCPTYSYEIYFEEILLRKLESTMENMEQVINYLKGVFKDAIKKGISQA